MQIHHRRKRVKIAQSQGAEGLLEEQEALFRQSRENVEQMGQSEPHHTVEHEEAPAHHTIVTVPMREGTAEKDAFPQGKQPARIFIPLPRGSCSVLSANIATTGPENNIFGSIPPSSELWAAAAREEQTQQLFPEHSGKVQTFEDVQD
jgi:hypothetical protein